VTYPVEAIFEEIAYLAYHLGWSRGEILDLEHADRLRFMHEVERLNVRARG